MLKILHSSDWHLGKRLYHKSREPEFRLFLDWLLEQLQDVDLLLVSGDVFDTNTPPVWAQEIYYQFLHRASQLCEIIVVAGNHDSAVFLEAPRALLKALRVHVVGNPSVGLQEKVQAYLQGEAAPESEEPLPELIPIHAEGSAELLGLVCALPYLKDSYLRSGSWEQKEDKLQQGIAAYYQVLLREAQHFLQQKVPIIATGHLFASGASTVKDDGVRELYIGSLGHFQSELFPSGFDYIALGHIHQPQKLKVKALGQGGQEQQGPQIRYSGAPLGFTFGERSKVVLRVDCEESVDIRELKVPEWQPLAQIKGNAEQLERGINDLKEQHIGQKMSQKMEPNIWLELEHSGDLAESIGLREKLTELAEQKGMEILRYRSGLHGQFASLSNAKEESQLEMLSELNPDEVFRQCLHQHNASESSEMLWQLYHSLLDDIALQRSPHGDSEESFL